MCHTFNALDLDDILKESNWRTSFKSSFKQTPKRDISKSEGIESENGFTLPGRHLSINRSSSNSNKNIRDSRNNTKWENSGINQRLRESIHNFIMECAGGM